VPESDDLLAEVKRLRQEQEDQGEMIQALLRHSRREVRAQILAELAEDPVGAEILLLVDGVRSQGDILAELQRREISGSSPMTVSRRFRRLSEELQLITHSHTTASGNMYRRTIFEKALGIARELGRMRRT
jgi:hypothetical protein